MFDIFLSVLVNKSVTFMNKSFLSLLISLKNIEKMRHFQKIHSAPTFVADSNLPTKNI